MKKQRKILIILAMVLTVVFSICGCGKEAPTAEKEILGKWTYFTGITSWNFVFNEDMTCSYWSGAGEPDNSTYHMEEGKLIIEGLDWDLYYKFVGDELRFWQDTLHDDGSRSKWDLTKDSSYDSTAITTLALTDEMLEEIEEEYTSLAFYYTLQIHLTAYNDDELKIVDWEVTDTKKEDPYTYVVYGVIYAEDNYKEKYKQNTCITFTAVENSEEENGYEIDYDVELEK